MSNCRRAKELGYDIKKDRIACFGNYYHTCVFTKDRYEAYCYGGCSHRLGTQKISDRFTRVFVKEESQCKYTHYKVAFTLTGGGR